jgi:hypothetical protein
MNRSPPPPILQPLDAYRPRRIVRRGLYFIT